jgi:putative membrane protein insertion efficiency factor
VRNERHVVEFNGATVECRMDDALVPSALRAFLGATPLDARVDGLRVPRRPIWLSSSIRALRWYRARVAPHLGQRCVFEPSCSRYAELALRERGFLRGLALSLRRLARCRPGSGGIDLP